MKKGMFLLTTAVISMTIGLSSCGNDISNEKKEVTANKKSENKKSEISDSVVVKNTDVKTNQVKQNSIEGTYANSENTILKISKATDKGFSFICEMKTECGGMETMKGFATYVNANKALTNISSEFDGDVFYIENGVFVRFEPNGSYIGMDCQRSFDTEFSKK